jgi:hypothetical protein
MCAEMCCNSLFRFLTFFDIEDVDGAVARWLRLGCGCHDDGDGFRCLFGIVIAGIAADLSDNMLKPQANSAAAAVAAAVLHDVLITASHRHATTGM